jgi:hypothetical protein
MESVTCPLESSGIQAILARPVAAALRLGLQIVRITGEAKITTSTLAQRECCHYARFAVTPYFHAALPV